MDANDLETHEIAALIALLQRMVVMDHVITPEETDFVLNLSESFKPAKYREALALANTKLRTEKGFTELLSGVQRTGARQYIYDQLVGTAAADSFATAELSLLVWIEDAWSLSRHPAVAAEWDVKTTV